MNRLFSVAGLFAVAALASSNGQTPLAGATIPFDFHAGQTLLPAGDYTLSQTRDILTIRGQVGKPTVMLLTIPASHHGNSSNPKLLFERYGDEYFLSQIWEANSYGGFEVPKCKQERELAKARVPQKSKEVTLQARNRPDHETR